MGGAAIGCADTPRGGGSQTRPLHLGPAYAPAAHTAGRWRGYRLRRYAARVRVADPPLSATIDSA